METGNFLRNELRERFIQRLEHLIRTNPPSRKERFLPFLIVLSGKRDDPRYEKSLNNVRYFLQNAMLFTKQDEDFYRVLKSAANQDGLEIACRWEESIQDCLKIVYDLR